ncbi:MAG: hypothetical protein LBK95_07210 [Bifidobacteriaceae bacterium]|nr:hypothetical protein [Bifidobacteriaceae bacterium]
MRVLVLDSEALSQLARAREGSSNEPTHALMKSALREGGGVVVPAAVLAEQYRGGHHLPRCTMPTTRHRPNLSDPWSTSSRQA